MNLMTEEMANPLPPDANVTNANVPSVAVCNLTDQQINS